MQQLSQANTANNNSIDDSQYQANLSAAQGNSTTVDHGTGKNVQLGKPAVSASTPAPSLGEIAAKLKADKAAKPAASKAKAPKAKVVMGEFKKGGKVKKTAIYKLHKNERVLNPAQTKKAEKMSGMKAILAGK